MSLEPYYQDGQCTIYCADCRDVLPSVPDCDLVMTDPPYGETSLRWDRWQSGWLEMLPSSSMWCFGSLRMFLNNWVEFASWSLSQEVIWKKHNGSNFHADRFRRVHEHALHFYKGNWADVYKMVQTTNDATARTVRRKERPTHTGEIAESTYTSQDGGPRMMTSVIEARSCHGYAVHPTQKPVSLLGKLIQYGCPENGIVIDPFMGSGSSLVAARDCGMRSIGIEVNEEYCEAAADRLRQKVLF